MVSRTTDLFPRMFFLTDEVLTHPSNPLPTSAAFLFLIPRNAPPPLQFIRRERLHGGHSRQNGTEKYHRRSEKWAGDGLAMQFAAPGIRHQFAPVAAMKKLKRCSAAAADTLRISLTAHYCAVHACIGVVGPSKTASTF